MCARLLEASAALGDIVTLYSVGQNKSQGRPQFKRGGTVLSLKEGGEKSHCKSVNMGRVET